MNRRLTSILVAAVVLGLVASGAAWLGRRSALNQPAMPLSPELPAEANAARTAASRSGPDQPVRADGARAPLPPQDTPLRLIQAELTARAQDGDAGAACRLAAELQRCEQVQRSLREFDTQLERSERYLATMQDAAQREKLRQQIDSASVQHGERVFRDADSCEGITQLSLEARVGYWRQAALAGNRGALLQYASGNAFQWRTLMEVLPQLQVYRQEAETLALRAAAAGDLRAVLALAAAYTPQEGASTRNLLSQSVKPDPARAVALYRFAEAAMAASDQALPESARKGLLETPRQALEGALQEGDAQRAQALAAQWQRAWRAPTPPDRARGGFVGPQGQVAYIKPVDCGD